MEKEIEIPEGYEARIEGNKVVFIQKENEDEKIRNIITDSVFYQYGAGAEYKDVLDYLDKLEKQKEKSEKPTNMGCGEEDERIRKGLVEYFGKLKPQDMWDEMFSIGDVLAYLEKQKDASKAIEAVDRIDKYIDEHVANAHDMKDSNPDKKYYSDVDDTLSDISGILIDSYKNFDVDAAFDARKPKDNWEYIKEFCDKFGRIPKDMDELDALVSYVIDKKQKEQKPMVGNGYYVNSEGGEQKPIPIFKIGDKIKLKFKPNYPYREIVDIKDGAYYFDELVHLPFERQEDWEKEQKPAENISQLTVKGKGVYKICPRCKERMIRDDSKVYTSMPPQYGYECPKCGEMEFDTVMYDSPETEEQKSTEWSEEDEKFFKVALWHIGYSASNGKTTDCHCETMDWLKGVKERLKSLSERFNLLPKQEWNDEDKKYSAFIVAALDAYNRLRKDNNNSAGQEELDKAVDWFHHRLKSLRPQQKPAAWSEEDEHCMHQLILFCENCMQQDSEAIRCATWLKSLRLQPHTVSIKNANKFAELEYERGVKDGIQSEKSRQWKPSEEQMDALNEAVGDFRVEDTASCEKTADILESLYYALQKLI